MDFPIFHIDFIGNRMLIAVDAILHVIINHALAVGALPIIVLLELIGIRSKDLRWDNLAYRLLKIIFIITTTVGALTGVGIWFSASLINPAAIGSLIRVFFWGWFTEWIVFVTEVSLIMAYFLSWQSASKSPEAKLKHLRLGIFLAAFSWITMAIIVAILGFMMDPGNWMTKRTLLSGLFNPMYFPQLGLRTTLAMVMGSMTMICLTYLFTRHDLAFRAMVLRTISTWSSAWLAGLIIASIWYYQVIPQHMLANIPVAFATQEYASWNGRLKLILIVGLLYVSRVLWLSVKHPGQVHGAKYLVSVLLLFAMLGQFERVREFIRKPFIIGQYMYANGIRVEDYPLLQRDGILQHATYASIREITADNQVSAGREVFEQACTRCHTVNGVNSIRGQLKNMYGEKPWQSEAIAAYVENMHGARYFMPPFPGNKAELDALSVYLSSLQKRAAAFNGAQTNGIPKPDKISASTFYGTLPNLANTHGDLQ
ncbi:c-type cytochrome [Methylobacter psychrophilus]|uniref:c-type cytochrome n=1 Tax=Methylobacter psychrophilus TaxID=96941 RepID=UPI0021D4A1F0|nr:cytochrome c [Methylobacter psychrophilus]